MPAPPSIDALFQLPPAEFTAARNALAAQLKKAGRGDEAARVKALSRPPVSAWTVNQLFWRHRKAWERLMQSGQAFREAQAAQLAGKRADLRRPLEARREALAELSRLAATLLTDTGSPSTPATMRRITTTLEALSTFANIPNAPEGGRLTDDVDPPGFETLAALIPSIGGEKNEGGPGAILPFQPKAKPAHAAKKKDPEAEAREREEARKAREAETKAARQRAERALREAQDAAAAAEAELKKAAARLKAAEQVKAALDEKMEHAAAELTDARQTARRITSEAQDAAQAVTDAERALEKLKQE